MHALHYTNWIRILCILQVMDSTRAQVNVEAPQAEPGARSSIAIFYDTAEQSVKFFGSVCASPTLKEWNGHLELVPFGNARFQYSSTERRYDFQCPSDPDCLGIKKHSCVVQRNLGRNISQMMLQDVCRLFKGEEVQVQDQECNDNFLANSGTRTESIKPSILQFPAVLVNDTYDELQSQEFVNRFELKLQELLGRKISGSEGSDRSERVLSCLGLLIVMSGLNLFL